MYIHEEFAFDVFRCIPAETGCGQLCGFSRFHRTHSLYFIKDDTRRLIYPEQSDDGSEDGEDAQQLPIRAWQREYAIILHPF